MKMRMKIDKKEKPVEVNFWDFLKGVVMSYIAIWLILFGVGFVLGVLWYSMI